MAAWDWNTQNILDAVGNFGRIAGAQAGGRAAGRVDEAAIGNSAAATDLARKRFALSAPSALASQAAVGDILGNVGRIKLNVPGVQGHAEGGLGPDMLKANPQLATLARQRMASLPNTLNTDTSYFSGDTQPQEGTLDKILGAVGTVAPYAGVLKSLLPKALPAAAPFSGAGTTVGTGAAPAAAPGATTGGGAGFGAGALGAGALAFGVPALAAYASSKSNDMKSLREDFAKANGFQNLAAFNEYLSTLGPQGQAARSFGETVVGKHDSANQQKWLEQVSSVLQGAGRQVQAGNGNLKFLKGG